MYAVKAAKRQAKGTADRDRMLKEVRWVFLSIVVVGVDMFNTLFNPLPHSIN